MINEDTGELLVAAGDVITEKIALEIENAGLSYVDLSIGEEIARVHGNRFVDAKKYLSFDPKSVGLNEKVYSVSYTHLDVYKRQAHHQKCSYR